MTLILSLFSWALGCTDGVNTDDTATDDTADTADTADPADTAVELT